MTYHFKVYMVFRSNELGQGPDHGIVCWNEAILDTRMSIGTARNATEAVFYFVQRKRIFHFWSTEIRILCEAATETANQKLGTTPYINSRPREMHISALVSMRKPCEVYSKFCVSSCRFRWKRGVFALLRRYDALLIFWKNHFWIHNATFVHRTLIIKAGLRTA
jgi:hypothetical protein